MRSSRNVVERASRFALSCALVLLCLSPGCGVPEDVGYWYEEAQPDPECTTVADCNDDNKCTTDKCTEGTCSHTTVSPDDGNFCTNDVCDPKVGISHTLVPIDDSNACTVDECDPAGVVSHTPISPDDGDLCTIDVCDPVSGVSHTPVSVDDGDLCTIDACDSSSGAISHAPVNVDDSDVCTVDTCDSATGMPVNTLVSFDDGNACTDDACDPVTGISNTPKAPCGVAAPESCAFLLCDPADGMCKPKDPAFQDDFADNSAGWQLDMQWQIGPAMASSGQQVGFPDPSQDFDGAAAGDNGVAGVNIGGNAMPTGGQTYYLTSPEIDLSSLPASETVFLDFWRWLNTAAPPAMTSNIEVWNGNAWVQVWTNAGALSDPAWQNFTYSVTAHKNAHFRVRFGLRVMNGAPVVSSWNLDRVRLIRHFDQGC